MERFLVAVLLLGTPHIASACGSLSPEKQREQDRQDLREQETLVAQTAQLADTIVIARADALHRDFRAGNFEVLRTIKGRAEPTLHLTWDGRFSLGCHPSSYFLNVRVDEGKSYVLYVRAGQILRAGSTHRYHGEISLRKELRLVRKSVRT